MTEEAAAQILAVARRSGVERLWFVSGSELTSVQEAAARGRVTGTPAPQLVTCPHEHVALTAALGDTMVTGGPSMTAAHADLGLLHHGGAIHNALRGDHPVLMLSGYPPTRSEARTSAVFWKQQRWDQGSIVRQYVKWDYKLAEGDDPGLVTARALQVALTPRTGPVYLAMPAEVGRLPVSASAVGSAQELGIGRLGTGDAGTLEEIAARLLSAERPLVITDRVGASAEAVSTLDELADSFGVAVRASRSRMNVRDDHPCKVRAGTLADFDAVLVVEHPVPWIPHQDAPAAGAWVGVVGTDPVEAEIPLYEFTADLRLRADPAAFLAGLLDALRRLAEPGIVERAAARRAALAQALHEPLRPAGTPTEAAAMRALGEVMSPEDLLFWEAVDTTPVPRTRPGTLFEKGGSSLGWAVAAAVGGRIASADRPTVAVTGDGSYLFGSPDSCLWLQQRHEAPVLTVVVNNRGHRTGTTTLAAHYPDGYAARQEVIDGGHLTPSPDFAAHAVSQGAFGVRVTEAGELCAAFAEARHAVESLRVPAVVDVWVPQHLSDRTSQPSDGRLEVGA